MDHEKSVTAAATALGDAIAAARAAGYRVGFPDWALAGLTISETGKVVQGRLVTDAPLAGTGDAIQLPPADGSDPAPPVAVIGRRSPPPAAA